MTQELSTTEAKQATAFARKEAEAFDDLSDRTTFKEGIEKGIEYALKELLPSRCVGFAEWVDDKMYWRVKSGQWLDNEDKIVAISTSVLYQKYITEYLKQQQDGRTSKEGI